MKMCQNVYEILNGFIWLMKGKRSLVCFLPAAARLARQKQSLCSSFFLKRTQKPHKDETFGLAFLGVHSKWLIDSTSHKTVKGTLPIFLASPKLIVIVIRTCLNYALLTTLAMTQETR